MNSKIFINDLSRNIFSYEYKELLLSRIHFVSKRLNFDYRGVTWYLYRYEQKNILTHNQYFSNRPSNKYGYCMVSKDNKSDEVYISDLTMKISMKQHLKVARVLKKDNEEKLFVDGVLLDEITHIQTRKNHYTIEYDAKFEANNRLYLTHKAQIYTNC